MVDVNSLLTVKDLIKDAPLFLECGSTALDVAKQMKKHLVDSVLIKDASGDIAGIVTKFDIINKVVAEEKNPSETIVDDIMTTKLLTIDAGESMFKARQIMLDENVQHLVVTDGKKQIGIVTSKEILGK